MSLNAELQMLLKQASAKGLVGTKSEPGKYCIELPHAQQGWQLITQQGKRGKRVPFVKGVQISLRDGEATQFIERCSFS